MALPDFEIKPCGDVATAFLQQGIFTFRDAALFVKNLPYGRNSNKDDLTTVFSDGKGTCSTKHALLKLLADECGYPEIRLMLGIFRMNADNTPAVAATLAKHGLSYIPEAHNYLKYQDRIYDLTMPGRPLRFENELLQESEMQPSAIGAAKVELHRKYLSEWLNNNKHIAFTPDALWAIREQCIRDLSTQE